MRGLLLSLFLVLRLSMSLPLKYPRSISIGDSSSVARVDLPMLSSPFVAGRMDEEGVVAAVLPARDQEDCFLWEDVDGCEDDSTSGWVPKSIEE